MGRVIAEGRTDRGIRVKVTDQSFAGPAQWSVEVDGVHWHTGPVTALLNGVMVANVHSAGVDAKVRRRPGGTWDLDGQPIRPTLLDRAMMFVRRML